MTINQNQLNELQRRNFDAAMKLAQLSIENSQRIMELQVATAKAIFEEGVKNAKALTESRDPQQLLALRAQLAQNATERMLACAREIADITSNTQATFGRMVTEQLSTGSQDMVETMQKMLGGMPMGNQPNMAAMETALNTARSAFEQITKASTEAFAMFAKASTAAVPAKPGKK